MKKHTSVLTKFNEFLQVQKNDIFECEKFNRRYQQENKSIEEYLTALYALVKTCDYGNLQEQLLQDRIVVGILDTVLSERMQIDHLIDSIEVSSTCFGCHRLENDW